MIQAGGLAWLVGALGFAAGGLLIASELTAVRYVTAITASCDDLASSQQRDDCLLIGHEAHHWAFALLGLFVILMSYGVAAGGSRPAAVALLVAGALGLGVTLFHDLPDTTKRGEVGVTFAEAKAHKGSGFWLELIGSSLAMGVGIFALWRTPPPRRERRPRVADPPDRDEPPDPGTREPGPDAPGPDAEEPASA